MSFTGRPFLQSDAAGKVDSSDWDAEPLGYICLFSCLGSRSLVADWLVEKHIRLTDVVNSPVPQLGGARCRHVP